MRQANHQTSIRSAALLLAEVSTLFAALATPYLLLDLETGRSASKLVVVVYLIWAFVFAAHRLPCGRPSWLTVSAAASLLLLGGTVVAGLLSLSLVGGVAYWTFIPEFVQPSASASPDAVTPIIMILVPFAIVFLGLLAAHLRQEDGPGDMRSWRLPRDSSGTLIVLAAMGVLGVGLFGVWAVGSAGVVVGGVVDQMTRHRTMPLALELALTVPALPISLLAATATLAVTRRLTPAVLMICGAGGRNHDPLSRRAIGARLVALGCSIAVLGGIAHVLQVSLASGLNLYRESGPVSWVGAALDEWMVQQHAGGRSSPEIAATLREHGHWMPEVPDSGLAALLSGIDVREFGLGIQESACRYEIDADVANVSELRSVVWMMPKQAMQGVRYCLAISCPRLPTIWGSDRIVILRSSHPSRNRYWSEQFYLGFFANGTADPGGYCTSLGTLSDTFQG